jgi:predicted nucleotidyltransferase
MTTNRSQNDSGISALFASRSLERLLTVLMFEPKRPFYQRELERLVGVRLRQLQRDLVRLEQSGLVSKTASGNRSYYMAVATHPAFSGLRGVLVGASAEGHADMAPAPEPDDNGAVRDAADDLREAAIKPLPQVLSVDRKAVARFCRRWKIAELALFGSVLRDDFAAASDVDVLVTFSSEARWTLFDHADMQVDAADLFGRKVDLVNRAALERSDNLIRRRAIFDGAQLLYAA